MERVPDPSLAPDHRRRLLYCGSVDPARAAAIRSALLHRPLSTRKVETAGIATNANGLWMSQIGRNLTDAVDGLLVGKRYLIHDRDPLFTEEFLSMLAGAAVKSVKLPPRSPNLNAHAERFLRSIKESCLDRMIWFGEGSLRKGSSWLLLFAEGECYNAVRFPAMWRCARPAHSLASLILLCPRRVKTHSHRNFRSY
jgi:hypothetical protein